MIPLLRRTVQAGSIPAAIRDNLLDCYSSFLDGNGAPKIALRKRKAIFIMIAALWSAFVLPLTSDQVSGSFCFVGEIQELLV